MKKDTFLVLMIIALLVLNLGTLTFLFFQNKHQNHFPHHPPRPDKLIKEQLHLTDEQIKQFENFKREHRNSINELEHEAAQLHAAYFSLLKETDYKQSEVDSFEMLLSENQVKKDSVTFYHFKDLRSICNDEQLKDFNDLIEEIGRILTHPPRPRP